MCLPILNTVYIFYLAIYKMSRLFSFPISILIFFKNYQKDEQFSKIALKCSNETKKQQIS